MIQVNGNSGATQATSAPLTSVSSTSAPTSTTTAPTLTTTTSAPPSTTSASPTAPPTTAADAAVRTALQACVDRQSAAKGLVDAIAVGVELGADVGE